MNTDENEWSLQAAEYVLGSLDEHDSRVFDQLYLVDDEWRQQVQYWRVLLDPLNASTLPVEAPPHIIEKVLAHINSGQSANEATIATTSETVDVKKLSSVTSAVTPLANTNTSKVSNDPWQAALPKSVRSTLNVYKERVRYWQLTATVAAVSALAVLFLTPHYLDQRNVLSDSVRTVAILQGDSDELLWAISYTPRDGDTEGVVSITVVGEPQIQNDQNHQLWMVLPESEEGVRSVGLMPDTPGQTITLTLPESLDQAQEFAVSLEATGGVEGPEHGPLVARTFIIEASNP